MPTLLCCPLDIRCCCLTLELAEGAEGAGLWLPRLRHACHIAVKFHDGSNCTAIRTVCVVNSFLTEAETWLKLFDAARSPITQHTCAIVFVNSHAHPELALSSQLVSVAMGCHQSPLDCSQ